MPTHSPPESAVSAVELDTTLDAFLAAIALNATVKSNATNSRTGRGMDLLQFGATFLDRFALSLILRLGLRKPVVAADNPAMTYDLPPGDRIGVEVQHSKSLKVMKELEGVRLTLDSLEERMPAEKGEFQLAVAKDDHVGLLFDLEGRAKPVSIMVVLAEDRTRISQYLKHPEDAFEATYHSVVPLRTDDGHEAARFPVSSGCALLLSFLASSVREFESSEQGTWESFYHLMLLLWAKRLDARAVPGFTDDDIQIMVDDLSPNDLVWFRGFAEKLYKDDGKLARRFSSWYQDEHRRLSPASGRRLERVFEIVADQLDLMFQPKARRAKTFTSSYGPSASKAREDDKPKRSSSTRRGSTSGTRPSLSSKDTSKRSASSNRRSKAGPSAGPPPRQDDYESEYDEPARPPPRPSTSRRKSFAAPDDRGRPQHAKDLPPLRPSAFDDDDDVDYDGQPGNSRHERFVPPTPKYHRPSFAQDPASAPPRPSIGHRRPTFDENGNFGVRETSAPVHPHHVAPAPGFFAPPPLPPPHYPSAFVPAPPHHTSSFGRIPPPPPPPSLHPAPFTPPFSFDPLYSAGGRHFYPTDPPFTSTAPPPLNYVDPVPPFPSHAYGQSQPAYRPAPPPEPSSMHRTASKRQGKQRSDSVPPSAPSPPPPDMRRPREKKEASGESRSKGTVTRSRATLAFGTMTRRTRRRRRGAEPSR